MRASALAPWLLGRVYYQDTFGRSYYTTFCICCTLGGGFIDYEEPPYNERT